MPAGRPTHYTLDLAKEICKEISCSAFGLESLCRKNPHWPVARTIFQWLVDREEFAQLYARAKEQQAEVLCNGLIEIVDKPATFIDENGVERNDVPMMRLQTDTYKWTMGRLKPQKYSERTIIETNSSSENEILKAELIALRAQLAAKAQKEF